MFAFFRFTFHCYPFHQFKEKKDEIHSIDGNFSLNSHQKNDVPFYQFKFNAELKNVAFQKEAKKLTTHHLSLNGSIIDIFGTACNATCAVFTTTSHKKTHER